METRQLTAVLSKSRTDGSGTFEAIVYDAAAGDTDGIFITAEGLQSAVDTFRRRGRNLVLRWMHREDEPDTALGIITDVWVDGKTRLAIRGQLDLANERSQKTYEGMLTGRINEFSISWIANRVRKRDGFTYVTDMELVEVSVVSAGANRGTRLVSIKAAPTAADPDDDAEWEVQQALDRILSGLARVKIAAATRGGVPVAEFRKKMLAKYGNDDMIRRALGLDTAESRAADAERERMARARSRIEELGRQRTRTQVLVDSRMRIIQERAMPVEAPVRIRGEESTHVYLPR